LALEESVPKTRSYTFYQKKLLQCNRHLRDMFRQASKSVYTSNVVSPDSLPPTPSTSSALKTPESIKEDPEDSEPADNGDIQMEYCADQLYSPSIGAVTKNYL
jgi:hypothetical protein